MLFDAQIGGHRYSADVLRVFYVDQTPVDYHVDIVQHAGGRIFVSKHRQLSEYDAGALARAYDLPERPTVLAPAHNGSAMYVVLKDGQLFVVADGAVRELVSVHLSPVLMAFKNVFVEGLESAVLAETFERLTGPLTIKSAELTPIPGPTPGFGVQARDMAGEMEFEEAHGKQISAKLASLHSIEELLELPAALRAQGLYYNAVLLEYLVCKELGLELLFKPCSDDVKTMFWRMYGINLFVLGGE